MEKQQQFLDVIDRDEAERRFRGALHLGPLGDESVELARALGRVLAQDVVADADVPSFDRSNFDGFAVRAADTYGAGEEDPRVLHLLDESIATASVPRSEVTPGTAMAIVTGGMLPRGADSVMMIEDTDLNARELSVRRAVTPGSGVTFAGTDVAATETVLWRGELLTSRETGVLAALGKKRVDVYRQPRVGILSTGDEIVAPGESLPLGSVYDSNARILADAVWELGAVPVSLGIVGDDAERLREVVRIALVECDVLLLSGGTSKGAGDISYHIIRELTQPGIVAHGVALKPGKPICLAAHHGKPVVVLPGFPTSAIFTFHEFVAPVIRSLGGRGIASNQDVSARMAVRVNSEIGRTEYLLVSLVHRTEKTDDNVSLSAYPLGKGSGSVTTFSRADGFVTIARHQEIVSEDSPVTVHLLSPGLRVADLVVMGSHCVGLDYLLGQLQERLNHTKFLAVGSTAGLEAVRRGECDLAGIHLRDAATGRYNEPFLTPDLELIPGYRRMQGIVFRPGDPRFEGQSVTEGIARATADPRCVMVNRNRGSGTRMLVDQLLGGVHPPGYALQPRNHNAVAAAVSQGRADWGLAIEQVARRAQLAFLPVTEEHYDFVVPVARRHRPAVEAFCRLLTEPAIHATLAALGCCR
ncbi:MAG: molybdopterin biosynthesis protein [Pirellulaceae bacterium]